ncbi:MAG TPA: CTP synthetase, partial [Archaeoglobus profundus]|nr:CTP synthetase [Archaeoglobus profundus]
DANSSELAETSHPVIDLIPEQRNISNLGGTMRKGEIEVTLVPGTLIHKLYGKDKIYERHRHRYGVNPKYKSELEKHGLVISGYSGDDIIEVIEYPKNTFFLGTQFHPEFKSRPHTPSPPFVGFVKAALAKKFEDKLS